MLAIKGKERWLRIIAHIAFWLVLTLFYYISNRLTGRLECFWSSTAIIMPIDLLVVYFDIEEPFLFFPALFGIFIGTYSFVFLFCGVRLFRAWLQDKQRHLELEQQHLESELRMLRSQINPHFISNTLEVMNNFFRPRVYVHARQVLKKCLSF